MPSCVALLFHCNSAILNGKINNKDKYLRIVTAHPADNKHGNSPKNESAVWFLLLKQLLLTRIVKRHQKYVNMDDKIGPGTKNTNSLSVGHTSSMSDQSASEKDVVTPSLSQNTGPRLCIVQARRNSTRLPDKVLMELDGKPVLEHVLTRCQMISGIDNVVLAGVDHADEQPLYDIATRLGVDIFRGSEQDVLSRYYYAAKAAKASWVMRVTADCPMLDPDICSKLVHDALNSGDFFGANAGWAHGMDCEFFSFPLLEKAHRVAVRPDEREHVTLWMKRQSDIHKYMNQPESPAVSGAGLRLVIDYDKDLSFFQSLAKALGKPLLSARLHDILSCVERHQDLPDINKEIIEIWRAENDRIHAED